MRVLKMQLVPIAVVYSNFVKVESSSLYKLS